MLTKNLDSGGMNFDTTKKILLLVTKGPLLTTQQLAKLGNKIKELRTE